LYKINKNVTQLHKEVSSNVKRDLLINDQDKTLPKESVNKWNVILGFGATSMLLIPSIYGRNQFNLISIRTFFLINDENAAHP